VFIVFIFIADKRAHQYRIFRNNGMFNLLLQETEQGALLPVFSEICTNLEIALKHESVHIRGAHKLTIAN
jgi:hypothetical protein